MRASGNPVSPKQLTDLLKKGEGETLEFKRSTAELQGAMQSLCAFMNGAGGQTVLSQYAKSTVRLRRRSRNGRIF
jgi:hypothetical protein